MRYQLSDDKNIINKENVGNSECVLQFENYLNQMFTHDCFSIEQLLLSVVWAVVASYDWLHDRLLIATTSSTIIINRTTDLFLFYLIICNLS